jgi:hypothetical protein
VLKITRLVDLEQFVGYRTDIDFRWCSFFTVSITRRISIVSAQKAFKCGHAKITLARITPGCPGFEIRSVRDLFLANVSGMSREGVVECGAINVLRIGWKVVADRRRKIGIGTIGHGFLN